MSEIRNRKRDEISQQVIERFYIAFSAVKPYSVTAFCAMMNTYRQKFYKQQKDKSQHYIDFSWLTVLVEHGVSANWLLTGKGDMMKNK